jgi:hypothetical protein
MTKSEREHYAKLARLGCILCQQIQSRGIDDIADSPVEIHHVRRYGGKRSLAPAIPLCEWHHRLDPHTSVHGLGHKVFTKYWGFSEEDLLENVKELLNE